MTANPIRLCTWPDRGQPGDFRTPPGGPPRIGDRITLEFHTEHNRPEWKFEYLTVEVVERVGDKFRGRVLDTPAEYLLPPGKLTAGDVLTFTNEHVFDYGIQPDD